MEYTAEKLQEELALYIPDGQLHVPENPQEAAAYMLGVNKGLEITKKILQQYSLFSAEQVFQQLLDY